MRSQSQSRNDKHTMMQYNNWINSTPSQQQLLSCLAQWLEHSVYNRGVASSSPVIGILTSCHRHPALEGMSNSILASASDDHAIKCARFVLKQLGYFCTPALLRRKLLNSDSMSGLRYILNLIHDVCPKEKS